RDVRQPAEGRRREGEGDVGGRPAEVLPRDRAGPDQGGEDQRRVHPGEQEPGVPVRGGHAGRLGVAAEGLPQEASGGAADGVQGEEVRRGAGQGRADGAGSEGTGGEEVTGPHGIMLCDDLIFYSRVAATARAVGAAVKQARSAADVLRLAAERPPGG